MDKDIKMKLKQRDEKALFMIKESYLSLILYVLQSFPLIEEDLVFSKYQVKLS